MVRDGLTLSKFRAEQPMLTLIELIEVKMKHEKEPLVCKGDTLPALLVLLRFPSTASTLGIHAREQYTRYSV
jgi:hypothetical protein